VSLCINRDRYETILTGYAAISQFGAVEQVLSIDREIGTKKDSGSARQGETANTRNVQPPESP
jgi:hypothetical protein